MAHTQNYIETSTWLMQAKDFLDEAQAGPCAQRIKRGGEGAARACEARGAIPIRTEPRSDEENLIGCRA